MVDNCLISKSNSEQDARIDSTKSTVSSDKKKIMGDVVRDTTTVEQQMPAAGMDAKNGHVVRGSDDDIILIDDSSSDSSHQNAVLQPPRAPPPPSQPAPTVVDLPPPTPPSEKGRSILENCLTRPMVPPPHPDMTRVSEPPVDNRKVEPLKINLQHREPIKTVIKLNSSSATDQQHSPKITIKPLKPPEPDAGHSEPIPKVHIKNLNESPSVELKMNSSSDTNTTTEPHIVPKLTVRKVHHSNTNNSIDNGSSLGSTDGFHTVVPKLTIKMDNHGHHTEPAKHKNDSSGGGGGGVLTSDGVKVTIKPIPEPPIKMTIKTNTDHTDAVVTSSNSHDLLASPTIPKVTFKPIQKPVTAEPPQPPQPQQTSSSSDDIVPKQTRKSTKVQPADISQKQQESTPPPSKKQAPKVNDAVVPLVPKLILKMGKSVEEEKQRSPDTSPEKSSVDGSILIESEGESNLENSEQTSDESPVKPMTQPLEVKTSTTILEDSPHSPRIILKINKTVTTEVKEVQKVNCEPEPLQENIVTPSKESPDTSKSEEIIDLDLEPDDPVTVAENDETPPHPKNDAPAIDFESLIANEQQRTSTPSPPLPPPPAPVLDTPQRTRSKRLRHLETQPTIPLKKLKLSDVELDLELEEPETVTIPDTPPKEAPVIEIEPSEAVDATPPPVKRRRGRPKKIIKPESPVKEPLLDDGPNEKENIEKPVQDPLQIAETDATATPKKTPGRGRGRGRGGGRIVEVIKDGRVTQVKMDAGYEDDDSPTFSLYNRNLTPRGRGRGRGRRGRGMGRGAGKFQTPIRRMNHQSTPVQLFEEDTMMGGDNIFLTPIRNLPDMVDESQSSQVSSASATTATTEGRERKRGKMEVVDAEGRTEFSVDRLAEYEWPPPKMGQKSRNHDTFMIQEQISEYLGIKSFKRKYPDLMRRPVEMEERNFMMERGLVSEKMCDLGLTAVYASEILDIMSIDYPEKYEEYRRFKLEKQLHESRQRQKQLQSQIENRGQQQRGKAVEAAANWNSMFNKDRIQNRKGCMDLQTYVVQQPKSIRDRIMQRIPASTSPSLYPIALVPGQFSEHYRTFTPEELACYPVNTVLLQHSKLKEFLTKRDEFLGKIIIDSSSDSDDNSSDSDDDTASSSDSSDSESDDALRTCTVCSDVQNKNSYGLPERFIECTSCQRIAHPSCIDMNSVMAKRAMEYNWRCAECKNCIKCGRAADENKMLYCDQCDRGYHIYCIGLRNVPDGRWHCSICTICTRCGSKTPEGHPNPSLTPNQRQNLACIANWTHEYRINNITKLREHYRTLCQPCQTNVALDSTPSTSTAMPSTSAAVPNTSSKQ